jgi:hypothetical protein
MYSEGASFRVASLSRELAERRRVQEIQRVGGIGGPQSLTIPDGLDFIGAANICDTPYATWCR